MQRHRASGFETIKDKIEKNMLSDLDIDLVMENMSTQKTKRIPGRFSKRPCCQELWGKLRIKEQPKRIVSPVYLLRSQSGGARSALPKH